MSKQDLVQRALRLLTQPPEHVESKEALNPQQTLDPILTIQPSDWIEWHRADGTAQTATVDFLHTDPDGHRWAFCSVADGWVAVNTKFVTMVQEGGQR